ncbi:3-hydroxyacyl-CoA dehydrogenase NAD-binding domain-containing protein [Allonocardiopsis opalescens]|uniref:3-hydroxyacyl-CoA dehydrogenase n=1 Tax=Allonocardiopsis opalescens TaxID=1144618 RepID=A0A2T0QAI4_9ACTN|nr:3-hydroxyacyl-CoA dehydrogenase NAD-binding domain-containing protein [Allonocardiopsis opalescens]PRY00926.1 3-hydroxyacyl-CoA dehydrogenase [Allonocardiopsis opalescens]
MTSTADTGVPAEAAPGAPADGAASFRRAVVVGAGAMGRGIAQVLAVAGVHTTLVDVRPGAVAEAIAEVRGRIARLAEKGALAPSDARAAAGRLAEGGLEAAAAADLVIEAVVEELRVKRELFAEVEARTGPHTVLATNTSSLSVTDIAAGLRRPERLCGLHFFNPVPLMKLVEVVPGERTAPELVDRLGALVSALGHTPVRVIDTAGFLVNHVGRALGTEALRLLDERIATPAQIDLVARSVLGLRMGPFELFDLTGVDVSQPVTENVYHGFYQDPRLRPSPTLRRRLAAGLLGRKNGTGFRADGSLDAAPGDAAAPAGPGAPPVWVSPAEPAAARLAAMLAEAGVPLAAEPGPGALHIVTPFGADVTAEAREQGLPAERTVGVDPFGRPGDTPGRTGGGTGARAGGAPEHYFAGPLTLASSPATAPDALRAAAAALRATGREVVAIRDSPGFIAQRLLAAIVNLAAETAQLGIAAPADIDVAVVLGLGYPQGPLAWGDAVGAARVDTILRRLHQRYLDPRYRPSAWLSRRAELGLSLTRPEARLDA